MKILFLSHRLPFPPDKGDKIRAFHLIRCLAKRHTVDVAALADDPADLHPARHANLAAYCRNLLVVPRPRARAALAATTCLPRGVAASLPWFHSRALARRVRDLARRERYDAVIAHSAPMAQYAEGIHGAVKVVDLCDVDSEKWKQYGTTASFPKNWIYAREARTLRAYECHLARRFDGVAIISEAEAALFRGFCPDGEVAVVPNGVDADHFRPRHTPRDPATVMFMGAMDYRPNVEGILWFHRAVWPHVLRARPEARLLIVGPRPTDAVRALDDLASGSRKTNTLVTGYVDDVREVLGRATVSVAPLHIARGVQNKVLEAMAAGLPVIATSAAHEGITAEPGRDLLVEDEAEEFAGAVARLLDDDAFRERIARNGRDAVVRSHAWDAFAGRMEDLIERAREARGGRAIAGAAGEAARPPAAAEEIVPGETG